MPNKYNGDKYIKTKQSLYHKCFIEWYNTPVKRIQSTINTKLKMPESHISHSILTETVL